MFIDMACWEQILPMSSQVAFGRLKDHEIPTY